MATGKKAEITIGDVFEKLLDQNEEIAGLGTKIALNSQATGELASHVADLSQAIGGRDGLNVRVSSLETKLSERTSTAPGRRLRLKQVGAGGGILGGGGIVAYLIYHFLNNPPW